MQLEPVGRDADHFASLPNYDRVAALSMFFDRFGHSDAKRPLGFLNDGRNFPLLRFLFHDLSMLFLILRSRSVSII